MCCLETSSVSVLVQYYMKDYLLSLSSAGSMSSHLLREGTCILGWNDGSI